jgi:hypothetical protein
MLDASDDVRSQVVRLVAAAVGDTAAHRVDLNAVEVCDDEKVAGLPVCAVGDATQDGCVTVTAHDDVEVWAGGDIVARERVVGAYRHHVARLAASGPSLPDGPMSAAAG